MSVIDWDYWASREEWKLHEAGSLLHGFRPAVGKTAATAMVLGNPGDPINITYEDLKRECRHKRMSYVPSLDPWAGFWCVTPHDVIQWAQVKGMKVPASLLAAMPVEASSELSKEQRIYSVADEERKAKVHGYRERTADRVGESVHVVKHYLSKRSRKQKRRLTEMTSLGARLDALTGSKRKSRKRIG